MSERLLDPKTTSLVSIDLQHGIVGLPVGPHAAPDVVQRTAQIAEKLRAAGGTVIFVRVANLPDGSDALAPCVDIKVKAPTSRPADWSELVPALNREPNDIVITKRQWGAFYGTDLDLHLRRRRIQTLIVTGIATNIGVESTARDAYERGFDQIFVEDAMSALGDGHAYAVANIFPRIGRLRTTAELLAVI
ncbi:nicotinamidase-related amidase [Methylovirgula ligni]|uniref:Nicotinamidase-related amidase n=1 Tax=Methylovirgula ligni TaxID=569860 RepID=A0A3D9Z4D0_9HYPH|nr:hydrolase [Methylovirgula ligni]REF89158.1 nicotinamidase-related amidase [Methylovirgula ligni]